MVALTEIYNSTYDHDGSYIKKWKHGDLSFIYIEWEDDYEVLWDISVYKGDVEIINEGHNGFFVRYKYDSHNRIVEQRFHDERHIYKHDDVNNLTRYEHYYQDSIEIYVSPIGDAFKLNDVS